MCVKGWHTIRSNECQYMNAYLGSPRRYILEGSADFMVCGTGKL